MIASAISGTAMTDASNPSGPGLAQDTAAQLRDRITTGHLRPGERLSEARLAAEMSVSRNTLREVFRLLVHEGLLTHMPHRGVSVAVPSMAGVLDIYRLRRLIEIPALAAAWPRDAAVLRMAEDVAQAHAAQAAGDWRGVGSANMRFHAGIVALADSPRLTVFFAQAMAELRLAFGLLDDPEQLHAPFLQDNAAILELLQGGDPQAAALRLANYLDRSERVVMTAFARREHAAAGGRGG